MAIEHFSYDVDDCKIALYNDTNDYGTAIDVMGISRLQVNVTTVSAELPGDAKIIDTHSRGVKARVTIAFAFHSLAPYALMLGLSVESSGADMEWLNVDNFNPPYFGLIAQSKATNGTGDTHIWLPKCKLMEGFQLQGQYGQYWTPELQIDAIDDETDGIFVPIMHAAETALVIPPAIIRA